MKLRPMSPALGEYLKEVAATAEANEEYERQHYSKTHRITYPIKGGDGFMVPNKDWSKEHQAGLSLEMWRQLAAKIKDIAGNVSNNSTDHQAADDCSEICRLIEDFEANNLR